LATLLTGDDAPPPMDAAAMLAAAIAKRGDPGEVGVLVSWAADEMRAPWQRTAILQGLDAGLPASDGRGGRAGGGLPGLSAPGGRVVLTPGRGVTLPAEPQNLVQIGEGPGEIAALSRRVAGKLDWPGKVATAPAVAPLTAEEQQRFDAGRQVFASLCAGCHGEDGRGRDRLGPSLVESKYVTAAAAVPIRILVGGKEGPIGLMPPLAGTLSDAQMAAALTYVRREWGHTASAVTELEVRELRQSTSTHKGPWTESELSAMLAGARGRGRGRQ
jgi:mono/diheme cytochrome c family protein